MFWKRKTPEPELEVDAGDQREHYRVSLPQEMPAHVIVARRAYRVHDLSAGGMAFAHPALQAGEQVGAILLLGTARTQVRVRLRVVTRDTDKRCHALFEGLDEDASALLHRFVLEVQKHQIRVTREMRSIRDEDL